MKQLAVEGANDSISGYQKSDVYTEILSLATQIENIAQSATYNGNSLLKDADVEFKFQVGSGTDDGAGGTPWEMFIFKGQDVSTEGSMADVTAAIEGLAVLAFDPDATEAPDTEGTFDLFQALSNSIDTTIENISSNRATLGAQMNVLSFVSTNLGAQSANLQASRSTVIDTDFSSETAKLTKGQIMQQAATAMLAQANQMPNVILSLLK
jgi:flagellin